MIFFEDKELENDVLNGLTCIAIPFEIFKKNNGTNEILTYRCFEKIAKEFETQFDDLLSDDALNWLDLKVNKLMLQLGYEHCHHEYEFMTEFKLDNISSLIYHNCDCIMKIDNNAVLSELCNNSSCDIELDDEEDDVLFAVVKNNKILSYAGINDLDREVDSVEISVETAPEEFNKGYGSSCVSALSKYLLNKNISVLYKTSISNIASINLAKSCGFVETGIRYSYYCEGKGI